MVFKMPIYCGNCKRAILKAVSKLQGKLGGNFVFEFFKLTSWTKFSGIDQITIDAYKGTVTVIGEVEPVCVAGQLRRVRRPNKEEEKNEEKKEEEHKEMPICCRYCSGETVVYTE